MRNLLLLLGLFIPALMEAQNLRSGGKLKPEQAIMDIRHYSVVLDVNPEQQTINGHTEIDLILSQSSPVLLFDLWNGLTIRQIWVDGRVTHFNHSNDVITVTGSRPFAAGRLKVKVAYGGKPGIAENPPWSGGFQWEKDSNGNPWIAISCQGEGAKIFFPCKDHPSDEPNEGAEMIITVPKGLTVAGPGLLKKVSNTKTKSTWHWKTNYTISNYCIIFNVGKFEKVTRSYTTIAGNNVPMEFYVLEENKSKAAYHLEMLEQMSRVMEKYFGEYPWVKEKIGLVETPHLGMEHQTLNAYGNKYRYTKLGGKDFDWLMAHEFGHEWWANKVTNKDWAHMWIQEGICVFGDALHVREREGEEAYQERMRQIARDTRNVLPIVRGDEVDSDDCYHPDIYGKGALFMHTLRYVIGDDVFFPTLLKLATDSRYTYHNFVTTDDVEELFSAESGRNLKPLFDFYLRTTNKLEIHVRQTGIDKFHIKLSNFVGILPIELITSEGTVRSEVDKSGITVTSNAWPQVDPKGFYLKRVILE